VIFELNDERPRRTMEARLERRAHDNLLVDGSGDTLLLLNDTALALWELCDGTNTVDEMVAAVVQLFQADAREVRQDVVRTIDRLHDVGAVEFYVP
jgi:pyrroloquinoline quinone biosynthesis protein D